VPVAVIERFEMIEIQEEQRAGAVVALSPFQLLFEHREERAMVRKFGQWIGRRERLQKGIVLGQPGVFLLDLPVQASNRASDKNSDAYPEETGTSP